MSENSMFTGELHCWTVIFTCNIIFGVIESFVRFNDGALKSVPKGMPNVPLFSSITFVFGLMYVSELKLEPFVIVIFPFATRLLPNALVLYAKRISKLSK